MAAMLDGMVDKVVQIVTNDGRNIVGMLKGFDQTNNVILDECHERVFSPDAGVEQARGDGGPVGGGGEDGGEGGGGAGCGEGGGGREGGGEGGGGRGRRRRSWRQWGHSRARHRMTLVHPLPV